MNGMEGSAGILKLLTTIGCGLMAGVFFAFSTLVMGSLSRLEPTAAIQTMQSINLVAVQSIFIAAFMGTGLLCLIEGIATWPGRHHPGGWLIPAACAIYLIGTLVVTMVCNVPLNDSLAAIDPHASGSAASWHGYLSRWTAWNHVRTVSSLTAMVLMMVGICRSTQAN